MKRCPKILPRGTSARRHLRPSYFSHRGLQNLAKPTPPATVFSGIQPTGVPHLGNYLGALRQWVGLQNTAPPSTKLIFCIVDLHAITQPQNASGLRRWKKEMLTALLAIGLNPDRCIIFEQSRVPAHSELMWILSCVASTSRLSRMTQWKVNSFFSSIIFTWGNLRC
jgi:tryptophanyl-tRNA synthetase